MNQGLIVTLGLCTPLGSSGVAASGGVVGERNVSMAQRRQEALDDRSE